MLLSLEKIMPCVQVCHLIFRSFIKPSDNLAFTVVKISDYLQHPACWLSLKLLSRYPCFEIDLYVLHWICENHPICHSILKMQFAVSLKKPVQRWWFLRLYLRNKILLSLKEMFPFSTLPRILKSAGTWAHLQGIALLFWEEYDI